MVKIFIDPGHGGRDSGASGHGLQEKDVTLKISKKIRDHLKKYSEVHIKMSRTKDIFVSLTARTKEANEWGADYFLSIHINSGGGTGFESYIYSGLTGKSKTNKYRDTIHKKVAKAIDMKDRGDKKANFHVLRESSMPAMLGENGFIDNKTNALKMKKEKWINQVGEAYAAGIAAAFDLKKHSSADNNTKHTNESETQATGQIASIQKMLNKKYDFSIAVDNSYGPETKKALLKAYQIELNRQFKQGLQIDGIWGPKTSAASVEVQRNAQGQLTWILQVLLNVNGYTIEMDGLYGKQTEKAVRNFQQKQGLQVDGIAGKKTYHALFESK